MKIIILRENEIRECVGMNKEAVDAVALGFTRLVEGKVIHLTEAEKTGIANSLNQLRMAITLVMPA